jgi:hypothetical protein
MSILQDTAVLMAGAERDRARYRPGDGRSRSSSGGRRHSSAATHQRQCDLPGS